MKVTLTRGTEQCDHDIMTITKTVAPTTIPSGQFKAKCLQLLDRVERTGRPLIVTKRGRPVAQVVPLDGTAPKSLVGSVSHQGDLISPIDDAWDAER